MTDTLSLGARVLPPGVMGTRRARHLIERNLLVYRRTWLVIVSGFFEPLFYLLSIGVGIGHLVGTVDVAGRAIGYKAFVAPALLASSAMNGAIYDSTINVFFKLKYQKTYDAVLATPLSVGDVVLGEISWAQVRGALYAVAFTVVMLAMGLIHSPWGILAIPTALTIGYAFAGLGMAATSFMRSWQDFDLVQVVMLPLFLFSATFYPLSTYPVGLRWVVQITPLYQGVAVLRALTTGTPGWATPLHVAYLLALGTGGLLVASRRMGRRLLT